MGRNVVVVLAVVMGSVCASPAYCFWGARSDGSASYESYSRRYESAPAVRGNWFSNTLSNIRSFLSSVSQAIGRITSRTWDVISKAVNAVVHPVASIKSWFTPETPKTEGRALTSFAETSDDRADVHRHWDEGLDDSFAEMTHEERNIAAARAWEAMIAPKEARGMGDGVWGMDTREVSADVGKVASVLLVAQRGVGCLPLADPAARPVELAQTPALGQPQVMPGTQALAHEDMRRWEAVRGEIDYWQEHGIMVSNPAPVKEDITWFLDPTDNGMDYIHESDIRPDRVVCSEMIQKMYGSHLSFEPKNEFAVQVQAVADYTHRLGDNAAKTALSTVVKGSMGAGTLAEVGSELYTELVSQAWRRNDVVVLDAERMVMKQQAMDMIKEISNADAVLSATVRYDNVTFNDVEMETVKAILENTAAGVVRSKFEDLAVAGATVIGTPVAGAVTKGAFMVGSTVDSTNYKTQPLDASQRRYEVRIDLSDNIQKGWPRRFLSLTCRTGVFTNSQGDKEYGVVQSTYRKTFQMRRDSEVFGVTKSSHEGDL